MSACRISELEDKLIKLSQSKKAEIDYRKQ